MSQDGHWEDYALCKNSIPRDYFFEEYESSETIAELVDQVCLSCPVMKQCFQQGIADKRVGVWGGIYLRNGEVDPNKNSHKSNETWDSIWENLE